MFFKHLDSWTVGLGVGPGARTLPHVSAWSMGIDYRDCIASEQFNLKRFSNCLLSCPWIVENTENQRLHTDGFPTLILRLILKIIGNVWQFQVSGEAPTWRPSWRVATFRLLLLPSIIHNIWEHDTKHMNFSELSEVSEHHCSCFLCLHWCWIAHVSK